MIEFKNIKKEFVQGSKTISVLNELNLNITEKGSYAIVGKSGSGKSTLLSLLAGLDYPSSGDIIINHQNINKMSENELTLFRAKNIGIVFQSFHLIPNFTALENVMLPLEILKIENPKQKAMDALKVVELDGRANHFPNQLSGGECQRVAIARAVVTNPKFILADEPSGSLDPDTGDKIMNILFKTIKELDQSLILVTHDMELARKCHKIYEMKNQKLNEL